MASANEGDSPDVRIVLLGVSGAGKSSTGNAILGREAFKETTTRESERQRGRVEDRNISIIDTPGFFNTHLTDEELQKQMMKSLDLAHPGPHVFLLIINLENFEQDQRDVVEEIQEMFGTEAVKFTMVLFIGREKVSRKKWAQMTESKNMKVLLGCFDGRFQVINSKIECDSFQITKLLNSIVKMVENNEGKNYDNEIYPKTQRKHKERMQKEEEVKEIQEERVTQEQQKGFHSKVEIKTKNTKYRMNEDDETKQEFASNLRIVLLGKTGSGKSSSGNTILGKDLFRASFISSTQTCEKQDILQSGRTISIIDTPGLLDVRCYKHLQDKLKREIEECLSMSAPGPHVFLLVVRLNGRHTDEETNTMEWIKNFGEDAVHRTVVLFTHTDLLKGESLDQYIRKSPNLQSLIDNCGGRFHSFNNEDRNHQIQVSQLLEKIDKLMKDNRGQHYIIKKSSKDQIKQKQKDTRPFLCVSTSTRKRQEQDNNKHDEKINTQNNGDDERNQEVTQMMERGFCELRRETDQLFKLVMDLKMDEMDLKLVLKK